MPTEFVHLHVHSDYSLLDGACLIYDKARDKKKYDDDSHYKVDLVSLAKKYNMPAVAITDHGFMGGAIEFYQRLNANKLKPIIGCEAYVSPVPLDDPHAKDSNFPNIKGFHLVLLAANHKGYENLCKLSAIACDAGFYYKPRIDKPTLAAHHEGVIALSACLQGEIAVSIRKGKVKEAKGVLQEYLDIMGKDNFYLELMDHGMEEQKLVNRELILLSKEFDVPLVATNDAHYLTKEHAKAHDLMLCIQTNSTVLDEKRMKFGCEEFYFKSGDEMLEVFKEIPEAISNTLAVAERCDLKIPFVPEVNHYPVYQVAEGKTQKEYLQEICMQGFDDRYGFRPDKLDTLTPEQQAMLDRMDYELGVIDKSKYCSYFLVVWDFINYARSKKIPVGPGRGSGAGSLVAYLTHITDIDPLRYNLLFERFLNPERVSPPDFDIDFCERRRGEVIEYVRGKYGADSVCQIGTYGTLKAKAVIKDVGRALGRSFEERNRITKLMDNDPKLTLESALENNPELQALLDSEPWAREIFEFAKPLENLNRNMSIHAAGVIISDQPLNALVPTAHGGPSNDVITQFPAVPCEELGLLKMDFLGLRTLTIIQDALDNIKRCRGLDIDIGMIPLDDPETFKLLNRGDTVAVFQLESGGMRELCRKFAVERIEDIIALIAIYRPGPMQFIPDFIARKTGQVKVEYDHPKMEPLLKETCGIMLYQEQIMQVVQVLGGFSLGGADILRRAIGKKKADVLAKQKQAFVEGCAKFNNIDSQTADNIWAKIELFAGYGFNKSHSAAYGFLSYRTAYLKANYPIEFMTAVLTAEITNAEKLAFFIRECREMGINILPPDVCSSNLDFTAGKEAIRFGLAAIKGVGGSAAQAIIDARESGEPFKDLMDFAERVGGQLNSRVIEALVRAGAFDAFGLRRSQLVEIMPKVVAQAQTRMKDKLAGQGSLFDFFGSSDGVDPLGVDIPDIPEFHEKDMLQDEKSLLGFYVSGHPLGEHVKDIKIYGTHSIPEALLLTENNVGVRLGGIITSVEIKTTKKDGRRFAILQLEDTEANIECMAFSDTYEKYKELLVVNAPVLVLGTVGSREEEESKKLNAQEFIPMDKVPELYTKEMHVRLHEATTKPEALERLKELCGKHEGPARTVFCVTCANGEIAFVEASRQFGVTVTPDLRRAFQAELGEDCLHFLADKTVPQPHNNGQRWKKREPSGD